MATIIWTSKNSLWPWTSPDVTQVRIENRDKKIKSGRMFLNVVFTFPHFLRLGQVELGLQAVRRGQRRDDRPSRDVSHHGDPGQHRGNQTWYVCRESLTK
jgi:hypothetical protein